MRIRLGEASAFFASVLLVGMALSQTADAQEKRRLLRAPTSAETGETSKVSQINSWTIGLAGGLPEGTFIRFAAEIARNLNDPAELRVLPVITQGATDNVKDLLYLKGIDVAITNADVLDYFKNTERIPNIEKRINFISEMVISEVHLVVRPEINSIKDLEGKKVSLGAKGAGQSTTGPIVFKRLGVQPEFVYINNAIALEKMKTGEIAAIVNNGAKPLDLLTKFKNDGGFKILPIPIDRFDEYYIPVHAHVAGLSGLHQAGREGRDAGCADGARRLQLAARERPLSPRAALHRALLRHVREVPRSALSSQMEEREPLGHRPRLDPL